jgi:hypothetical protein
MTGMHADAATLLFVDTSAVLAIEFDEPGGLAIQRTYALAPVRYASALLEAEYLSRCRREQRVARTQQLDGLSLLHPPRSLAPEIARVLDAGYLRGADCWHLATALWLTPDPAELLFLTLDERQREIAQRLGFQT